ncbi:hypothetical protein C3489_19970 [Streptomyces sp. Ru71]|nr:hypothetical protein C3489_19970 [Streptomyces sp. Ru71]
MLSNSPERSRGESLATKAGENSETPTSRFRLRLARQRRCPRAERADGCSWMVAKYFGITERDTLKSWTVLESVLSLAGFAVALVLSIFV